MKLSQLFFTIGVVLLTLLVYAIIGSGVFYHAFNAVSPAFGGPHLTLGQSFWALVLLGLVGSNFKTTVTSTNKE